MDDDEHEIDDDSPVARIMRWLLNETADLLERQDINWKVIIHGSSNHIKPVVETYYTAI